VAEPPLSIVHITAPAPVGGLERVVQTLAIGQHRDGHVVRVIAVVESGAEDHPFVAPLRQAGVPVTLVQVPGRAYFREMREVRALLEAWRPDIVHTHGYRSDLLDGHVARRLGIPIVSTVHGSSRMGGISHFFEWLQRRAWRRFDGVVVVSQALERALAAEGVPGARMHMIPNAWPGIEPTLTRAEARARLGLADDVFAIGFVGRLIPAKGPDVMVRALAQMREPGWSAVVVGDGGERAHVEQLCAEHGLHGRVSLVGHLDDATHLFRAFDVFVLSSRTEGTPIVLFEAIAARVPVVATAVGGVPEAVSGDEALLVPSEDPGALAAAIGMVATDRSAAAARATRARARLEREYSTESWLKRHEQLYRTLSRVRA
jgi:glycosyltransferase involved in cell wall biosynthesis